MKTEPRFERKEAGNRQPSPVVGPEKRRIERKLQDAGVLCQPEVSIQYQTIAKRAVLRGVESGGSNKDMGRYVTFCNERGECIPWLQPIDTVATNGRHAVVMANGLRERGCLPDEEHILRHSDREASGHRAGGRAWPS